MEGQSTEQAEPVSVPLYLARLDPGHGAKGTIVLTDGSELQVGFSGEIVTEQGAYEGREALTLRRIERISLWIDAVDQLGGLTTLAGPARPVDLKPGMTGEAESTDLRLYYPALEKLYPVCEESDATYPKILFMRGRLTWLINDQSAGGERLFGRVSLVLDQPLDEPLPPDVTAIKRLALEDVPVQFQQLVEQSQTPAKANSLMTCSGGAPAGGMRDQRALRLRFVNLSRLKTSAADLAALENTVQDLIDGACKTWWTRGGVKIELQSNHIETPAIALAGFTCATGPAGFCVSVAQEGAIKGVEGVTDAVEVYLVDRLTGREGGGITHYCGTADAYVILEIEKAENNRYLLAHELGHVLGLTHPNSAGAGGCPGFPPGTDCSVMIPDSPNSSRNTEVNLTQAVFPLGPIFTAITTAAGAPLKCGLNASLPVHFSPMLRDFPYDDDLDATEESVLEAPFTDWWSNSDIWNAKQGPQPGQNLAKLYLDGTSMFGPNSAPRHFNPTCIGSNFMFVRVRACETLAGNWVDAHVFLAVPGASTRPLFLLPAISRLNPIQFRTTNGTLPRPGLPQVDYFEWSRPANYPPHCCAFAVITSGAEATPSQIAQIIANPANFTFSDLFGRLVTDNDVAQRNLDFEDCPLPGGLPLPWPLPWIELGNPFQTPAKASVEIETVAAGKLGLQGLALEVNGQLWNGGIEVGAATSVSLPGEIMQGENLAIRFRATLPGDAPLGTAFPVGVGLYLDGRFVSGYRYALRVVSPAAAIAGTTDLLAGALGDATIGAGLQQAGSLVDEMVRLVIDHKDEPEHILAALGGMAGRIADLAQAMSAADETPAHQAVLRALDHLAGVLRDPVPPEAAALAQHVAHIRDSVDRVYEASSRLNFARVNG